MILHTSLEFRLGLGLRGMLYCEESNTHNGHAVVHRMVSSISSRSSGDPRPDGRLVGLQGPDERQRSGEPGGHSLGFRV